MKFFDIARAMAKLSTFSEEPREQTGAIIVLRNEVVSTGYNRNKSHPLQAWYARAMGRPDAIFLHAEMSALTKINKQPDFSIAKLFVFRETKRGLGMAKPCEICTQALSEYGIKNIYYTTDNGYGYERWE